MIPRQTIRTFLNGRLLLYTPTAPLSQFVNHIWYVKECNKDGKTVERFLPNGSMDLVFNLGDEPEILLGDHSNDQILKRCWVSGLQAKYVRIEAPAHFNMVGVEFKAGVAYPFFGFPLSELRESSVDLDLIWGTASTETLEILLESKSDEEKFCIVENLLLRQLKSKYELPPVIAGAIQLILMPSPILKIRAIADRLQIDHKRFISQFEMTVGITPKIFSRICRFQRSLRALVGNGHVDLTTVAVSCDYFDQAHFIKEFEAFSGLTPGEYLQVKGPFPGWIPDSKNAV